MKKSIKKRWLAALRSGEYQQAREVLRRVKEGVVAGHCCLGVLCDITRPESGGKWQTDGTFQLPGWGDAEIGIDEIEFLSDVDVPDKLKALIGMEDTSLRLPVDHPVYSDTRLRRHLGSAALPSVGSPVPLEILNDSRFTFAEIADLIEQHFTEEEDAP